jgi:DNA invertase Pin-like site-specific DNA recombinase
MSSPRRTAVSYTRFSSPGQAKGDSETRQEREYKAFCERHNLAPGKEVFIDRGRSGYHGTHRTKGSLGVLVRAAKDGRFEPGTVIVVEAWDRLGRLRPDKQIELVSELLQTGVDIGVCRLNEIFTLEDFGSHKWTTLSVFISLAFNESKQKSDRLKSAWAGRRKRAQEDGAKIGGTLPAWVEHVRGELRLIPERAAAVRRIYELAIDGNGVTRIVRALDSEKVKPFGTHKVSEHRTRSAFAGRWTKAYVGLILRDRRTMGEHQLRKAGQADGAPIAGYYPAAVSEDVFNLARAAQGEKGRKAPRQRKYCNVFRGLLVNARDGTPMNMANVGSGASAKLYLKNTGGTGSTVTIPYGMFERCVLGRLRELRAQDVLPGNARPATSADTIRANLVAVRGDLAKLKADLKKDGYSKTLSELVREAEAEEINLVNDLSDELARTAKPLAKAWDDAAGLLAALDGAEDRDAMRIRIRAALAPIVESGVVLVTGTKSARVIAVQFDFVGGARRTWIICYLPASGARPNPPEPAVTSEAFVEELDLRDPADAKEVEKHLGAIDVGKLVAAIEAKNAAAKEEPPAKMVRRK